MKFTLLLFAGCILNLHFIHAQNCGRNSGRGIVVLGIQYNRMGHGVFCKQVYITDLNTPRGIYLDTIKIDEELFFDDGSLYDSTRHDGLFTSRKAYKMVFENRNAVPVSRCWIMDRHFLFDERLFSLAAEEGTPPCMIRCDFYYRDGILEINYSAFGQGVSW